jgi:membrane-associated phospholipid phosphatase
MRCGAIVCILALVVVAPCRAQGPYQLQRNREWVWLGTGAALSLGSLALISQVEPFTVSQLNALNVDHINTFDRNGMHPYRAAQNGDILAAATYLFPFTLLLRDDTRSDWRTLAVMWGEATLLDLGIVGVVKSLTDRARPYAYDPNAPLDQKTSVSARLSYYSGHTSGAAVNSFFVARVYSDYLTNRNAKIALWTGAAVIPAVVGYLRVDAGRHFRTDAITGYVVGAAIGYLVPELHRHPSDRVSLHPASVLGDPGVGVSLAF